MSLGRNKWLLDDRWSTNVAYHLILNARIFWAFQRVTMTVGNNDVGVHSIILNAGNDGVGVCSIMTNSGNSCICVRRKCLLGAGS